MLEGWFVKNMDPVVVGCKSCTCNNSYYIQQTITQLTWLNLDYKKMGENMTAAKKKFYISCIFVSFCNSNPIVLKDLGTAFLFGEWEMGQLKVKLAIQMHSSETKQNKTKCVR